MERLDSTFEEACRVIGECCVMLAQSGEEISISRVVLRLERVQQSAVTITGKPNESLYLAIELLKGL